MAKTNTNKPAGSIIDDWKKEEEVVEIVNHTTGEVTYEKVTPKKTRAARTENVIYTIKQYKTMVEKMHKQKLLRNDEYTKMVEFAKTLTARYVGLEIEEPTK